MTRGRHPTPHWILPLHRTIKALTTHTTELLLPNPCAGCGGSLGPWCHTCEETVTKLKPQLGLTAGGHLVSSISPYHGALRSAIVSYKERQRRPLAAVLGRLLATSLDAHCGAWHGTLVLVPAPSRPWANRWRGWAHMLDVALWATHHLQHSPVIRPRTCTVWPVLATRWWAQDQQQLNDNQRQDNARRAIYAKPAQLRAIAQYVTNQQIHDPQQLRIMVVDDVVTSGATLDSCLTSLQFNGYKARSAAVICAARRD